MTDGNLRHSREYVCLFQECWRHTKMDVTSGSDILNYTVHYLINCTIPNKYTIRSVLSKKSVIYILWIFWVSTYCHYQYQSKTRKKITYVVWETPWIFILLCFYKVVIVSTKIGTLSSWKFQVSNYHGLWNTAWWQTERTKLFVKALKVLLWGTASRQNVWHCDIV